MQCCTNLSLFIYVSDKGHTHAMSTRQSSSTPAILSQANEGAHDDETATNYSRTTEEYSIPEDPTEEDDGAGSNKTVDYSRKNRTKD